jgi:hypothetical protein
VVVVVLDVLLPGEPEPMEPLVELSLVPGAPMEVPLPVVPPMPLLPVVPPAVLPVPLLSVVPPAVLPVPLEPLAVEPVLGVVPMEPLPLAVLLLLESLGDVVVDGVVLDVLEEVDAPGAEVEASSRLPQALSDTAAMRARAAHCAIGDLIIRNSLRVSFRNASMRMDSAERCLRLTLVSDRWEHVVCRCRSL